MDLAAVELFKLKTNAHAPCIYYDKDRNIHAPSINCTPTRSRCRKCGFNPAEQRRRLQEGKMMPKRTRMAWIEDKHFANGGTVKEIECPPGTMQLVFPAENEGDVSE